MTKNQELWQLAEDRAKEKNIKYERKDVKLIYWDILRKKRLINNNK